MIDLNVQLVPACPDTSGTFREVKNIIAVGIARSKKSNKNSFSGIFASAPELVEGKSKNDDKTNTLIIKQV